MDKMISVTYHCESCGSDFDVPVVNGVLEDETDCPCCGSDQTYGACANYKGDDDAKI